MSKNNNTKNESINILNDISSTGDTKTNDFDLIADKLPALSTIRTQIRSANNLIKAGHTLSPRIEFDRLKIALNLIQFGETVGFENLKMEDVENPKDPPSYTQNQQLKWDLLHDALYAMDEIQSSTQKQNNTNDCFDEIDVFIPNEFKSALISAICSTNANILIPFCVKNFLATAPPATRQAVSLAEDLPPPL